MKIIINEGQNPDVTEEYITKEGSKFYVWHNRNGNKVTFNDTIKTSGTEPPISIGKPITIDISSHDSPKKVAEKVEKKLQEVRNKMNLIYFIKQRLRWTDKRIANYLNNMKIHATRSAVQSWRTNKNVPRKVVVESLLLLLKNKKIDLPGNVEIKYFVKEIVEGK